MKVLFPNFLLFALCLFTTFTFRGQHHELDSINRELKNTMEDTVRYQLLYKKNVFYRNINNYDSAIDVSNKIIQLSEQIGDRGLFARAYRIKAQNYNANKEYDKAVKTLKESIRLLNESDTLEMAKAYDLLGRTIYISGDVAGSITSFFESSKYYEKLGTPLSSYRALGIIYGQLNDLQKAFDYNQKVIQIALETEDYPSLARAYLSQGYQYKEMNKNALSIKASLKAVNIYVDTLNKPTASRLSLIYGNIAEVYLYYHEHNKDSVQIINPNFLGIKKLDQAILDTAEYYIKKSIEITELGNDQHHIYNANVRYGDFLFYQKKYNKALKYYLASYKICQGNSTMLGNEVGVTSKLYQVYKVLGKNGRALKFYEQNVMLQDSLFNQDKQRELGKQEAKFEFEKQQAIEEEERAKQKALADAKAEKEKAVADEKARNQLIIIYSIGFGMLLISVFSVLIYKRLRIAKKQQRVISGQKKIIEKNRNEMLESIEYSKNIQQRIFPTIHEINNLLPESFIYFKSKDVVSGDFYWAHRKGDKTFFSVADCTGHGVPGAFMTLISLNIINSIILEKEVESTATVLEYLHERLKDKMSEKKGGQIKHGLDIAMCAYNHVTHELEYSGLHNPLYIIDPDNELTAIKGDNLFLGISENFNVSSHKKIIQPGTSVYMSTDGFPDQKGGEKGKKYYYSRLRNLLRIINSKPIEERSKILNQKFEEWKGDKEQIDDVCIMGVTF
ncbi:MAG: SpoIIE family protein phosphatase [Flavobacteriales bacterium]|jgi:serine phosphatase RsbU (regulator of sigma subunit)|nr:SpoIIE family protein phosphatase [Flavobacteriales bacterium]